MRILKRRLLTFSCICEKVIMFYTKQANFHHFEAYADFFIAIVSNAYTHCTTIAL